MVSPSQFFVGHLGGLFGASLTGYPRRVVLQLVRGEETLFRYTTFQRDVKRKTPGVRDPRGPLMSEQFRLGVLTEAVQHVCVRTTIVGPGVQH